MKRILVVDDHGLMCRGIRTLVETRRNLEVVGEAANGRDALRIAQDTRPDIAILDYSLPGLNGLELTLALRKELPQIRVLIYTFHNREEIIAGVLEAGASGYVLKSDSEEQLLAAIDALAVGRTYFSASISETLVQRQRRGTDATLTGREREVVKLVGMGKINKEVAHVMGIAVKTVETHRSAAMDKLNIRTTAELVRYALRNNIIEP